MLLRRASLIPLSPANTELAFAAGITPVGVSSYSDYPPEAQKNMNRSLPRQGNESGTHCGAEAGFIVAPARQVAERRVKPTDVILGIKVAWVDAVSIEQIADTLRQLAARSPQPEKAQQAAQTATSTPRQRRVCRVKAKKRVFLQFGMNPPFTSGKGFIQHQVLTTCEKKRLC